MSEHPSQPSPSRAPADFSIADGAPFLRLQRRLGLVGDASLAATRRASFFAALCWLPLLLLATIEGSLLSPGEGRSFLRDFTVPARFLLAVPLLLLVEPIADARLARVVREFQAAGLVPEARVQEFRAAVIEAHRGRDSGVIEGLLAAVAIGCGIAWAAAAVRATGSSWVGAAAADGTVRLSAAGSWAGLVSVPIAVFLLLRWLWRYGLWVRLLRRISRLDLRLVATHPDRCGGLAFVGRFPAAFAGFAFAVSAVVAAALARLLTWGGARVEDLQWAVAAWSLGVVGLFVLPLASFARPLRTAKERALLRFAALSLRHDRAFERRWIEGSAAAEDLLGSADTSSLADLAAGYHAAKATRAIPVVAEGLVPVAIAVAIPLVCAIATQVPVRTMLRALGRFAI